MSRILLLVPYALQLLCIVHAMKTGRAYYWIWIVLFLPYVGGLAYLIVEILPELRARHRLGAVRERVTNVLVPGRKLQALRDRAAYSPTVENRVEYADALAAQGDHEAALAEYRACLEGPARKNTAILFKAASALFSSGDYSGASEMLGRLPRNSQGILEQKAWNALRLRILEETGSGQSVAEEYERIRALLDDREMDLQYLEYLDRIGDDARLSALVGKIRTEEASLRGMNVRYDRTFYRKAYEIARRRKA